MIDAIFNVRECAEQLGVTEDTIRKYIRDGKLKGYCHRGYRNRKEIKVVESDLKQFIYLNFLEPYWAGRKRPAKLPKIVPETADVGEGKENGDE